MNVGPYEAGGVARARHERSPLSLTLCLSVCVCVMKVASQGAWRLMFAHSLSLCVQWRDSASPKHAYKTRIMNVRTQDTF